MPYKTLIGRRPMSTFFKNYPKWGRAVLTLAQSTTNESVKSCQTEFRKRNHGRKLREVMNADIDIFDDIFDVVQ